MTFREYFLKENALQGKVRDWIRKNGYVVHATDSMENLQSILASGLRPGTQMSNSEGQGLESGPYVLVYPGKAVTGRGVDYRPGDLTHTRVKGKPIAIIFDNGHFCDIPSIEELEKRNDIAMAEYEKTKELGGRAGERAYQKWIRISDEYYNALENPNHSAKCGDDFFKELLVVAQANGIPAYKMDWDDELDTFKFIP